MKRPPAIWFAFLACAALVLGALGMVSHHAVEQEERRALAEAEAELGQRVRLALWRMESEAASLLVLENNRPPSQFRDGDGNLAAVAAEGGHALLYFEVDADGRMTTPGLPREVPGSAPENWRTRAAQRHQLRELLGLQAPATVAAQPTAQGWSQNGNYDIAYAAANAVQMPSEELANPGGGPHGDMKAREMQQQVAPEVAPNQEAVQQDAQGKAAWEYRNEFNQRAALVQRALTKSSQNLSEPVGQQADEPAPVVDKVVQAARPAPPPLEAQVTAFQPVWIGGELLLVRSVGNDGARRVQGVWLSKDRLARTLLGVIDDLLPRAELHPYQPLVFTRENVLEPTDNGRLSTALWKATPRTMEAAPLAMVGLPWELVPGETATVEASLGGSLKLLLGTTWLAVLLGLAAVGFLLHGVLALSERRASFVSSVTHELRTPLTTFRLYSELLADGMVKDGEKQQGYLRTLQSEAGRLSHLVENVLAYSRIERGSARARLEELTVEALAGRIVPRIEERAQAAQVGLLVNLPGSVGGREIFTDVTAVEQILFNLVDNACKYGLSEDGRPIEVDFEGDDRRLRVSVRDRGAGIDAGERGRLFHPFHKAAHHAAPDKPGVGLGLSLSRRLAGALGGKLEIIDGAGPGACFRLTLPLR